MKTTTITTKTMKPHQNQTKQTKKHKISCLQVECLHSLLTLVETQVSDGCYLEVNCMEIN